MCQCGGKLTEHSYLLGNGDVVYTLTCPACGRRLSRTCMNPALAARRELAKHRQQ